MSVIRHKERLLGPEDFQPTREDWQVIGALNPAAIQCGDMTMLVVRVAERPLATRSGQLALPRWDPDAGPTVDWVPEDQWELVDPRVVRHRDSGLVRLTFLSHLRVMASIDGRRFDEVARFDPASPLEQLGVEDPRITLLDDRYYMTYVSVSQHGVATSLAVTDDFQQFERLGVIFCPENKDVVLFPELIDDTYVALHRPNAATPFTTPEMWLARSGDLLDWGTHEPLVLDKTAWELDRVGAGAPPLRTERGWLEIYHGSRPSGVPGKVGTYSAGALVLAVDDPARVVGRTLKPLIVPDQPFEQEGFVPNVVFPTGIVPHDDELWIYYGAADTCCGLAIASLAALLDQVEAV